MDLSWLTTAVLGIIIFSLIYWLATKNNNYWEKRGVPYIKGSPIFGSSLNALLRKKTTGELFDEIYKKLDGKKFGGCFQFISPMLVIRDPELINHVLIKDFSHFEDRMRPFKNACDLFSLSMVNLSGDEWRNVRHKLTPTFTSGKLKTMFDSIKKCSEEALQYTQERTGEDIETKDFMLRYVYNVIGCVAFGLKLNTLDNKDDQSKDFIKYASKIFHQSWLTILKFMICMPLPKLRGIFKVKFLEDDVDNFFRKLISDMIKYRETMNTNRNDFLHLMLELKKKEKESLKTGAVLTHENEPIDSEDKELMDQLQNTPEGRRDTNATETFTEECIAAQSFLFLAAGSETTASSLSFVFSRLAMHQDLQKKVHDEVANVLSTQEFNYQAIKKMTYMEQFINETFRLYPSLPVLSRFCTRDYKVPGTDVIIEKGIHVYIPIYSLHMDPQYFPNPEKFDPDRFENEDGIPKGVYSPFGSGPRMCIAMRLAMLEMKIILAMILLNYTVILSEKTEVPLKLSKKSFVTRAESGVWVKFQKREV